MNGESSTSCRKVELEKLKGFPQMKRVLWLLVRWIPVLFLLCACVFVCVTDPAHSGQGGGTYLRGNVCALWLIMHVLHVNLNRVCENVWTDCNRSQLMFCQCKELKSSHECRITSRARGSGAEGEQWINNFTPSPHTHTHKHMAHAKR